MCLCKEEQRPGKANKFVSPVLVRRSEATEKTGSFVLKEKGPQQLEACRREERGTREIYLSLSQMRGPWGLTAEHPCSPDRQGQDKVRGGLN